MIPGNPTSIYEEYIYRHPAGSRFPAGTWAVEERDHSFSKPVCFDRDMFVGSVVWTKEPVFPFPVPTKAPAYLTNVVVADDRGKLWELEYAYLDGFTGLWDGYTRRGDRLTFEPINIVSFTGGCSEPPH